MTDELCALLLNSGAYLTDWSARQWRTAFGAPFGGWGVFGVSILFEGLRPSPSFTWSARVWRVDQ